MTRFLLVFWVVLAVQVARAQTSELYLTSWGGPETYVVRDGRLIRKFLRRSDADGPALVVHATVKPFGHGIGDTGHEHDFAGKLLAGTYPNDAFVECLDGATDGTRNWSVRGNFDACLGEMVVAGDSDWGSIQIAFPPEACSSGIAHDPTDDTLWITSNDGIETTLLHYTTTGTLLAQHDVTMPGRGIGLALDPADQTLWIPGAFDPPLKLVQCDKSGNVLQVVDFADLDVQITGAEFGGEAIYEMYCVADSNSTGAPAILSAGGSASASAGDLTLYSAPVPDQNGVFFHAHGQTQMSFGNGYLCANGGIVRGAVVHATGNEARYVYDGSDARHSLSGFVGLTRNFQHWFRDPMAGGALFDTSTAISIAILP